jgi:hypothetical protein
MDVWPRCHCVGLAKGSRTVRNTNYPPARRTHSAESTGISVSVDFYIQALGYDPDDLQQTAFSTRPPAAWRLLRQDLYLNGQPRAFLIVHWKHTLDFISLVDVIPGDETEWVR